MNHRGYALTSYDIVLISCLEGAGRHLACLAVLGRWDAMCDRLDDRLGFYGLGRN